MTKRQFNSIAEIDAAMEKVLKKKERYRRKRLESYIDAEPIGQNIRILSPKEKELASEYKRLYKIKRYYITTAEKRKKSILEEKEKSKKRK